MESKIMDKIDESIKGVETRIGNKVENQMAKLQQSILFEINELKGLIINN